MCGGAETERSCSGATAGHAKVGTGMQQKSWSNAPDHPVPLQFKRQFCACQRMQAISCALGAFCVPCACMQPCKMQNGNAGSGDVPSLQAVQPSYPSVPIQKYQRFVSAQVQDPSESSGPQKQPAPSSQAAAINNRPDMRTSLDSGLRSFPLLDDDEPDTFSAPGVRSPKSSGQHPLHASFILRVQDINSDDIELDAVCNSVSMSSCVNDNPFRGPQESSGSGLPCSEAVACSPSWPCGVEHTSGLSA